MLSLKISKYHFKEKGVALYYLIYSSIPTRALSDEELDELLNTARSANSAHGVTGMLICFKDLFVQLIEGEEMEIKQLYKNLLTDPRHYRVQTLKEGEIDNRFFSDWSMGFERKEISLEMQEESLNLLAEKSLSLLSILDSDNHLTKQSFEYDKRRNGVIKVEKLAN